MNHSHRCAHTPGTVTALRQGAFTLIELLVVIAIIAILAAILFPVFAQVREKARATACLSNTKQLSLGVQMYSQDYDEKLPILGILAEQRGRWMWQIMPYVKNRQIFTDPNTPRNAYDGSQWTDRTGYGWSLVLRASDPAIYGTVNSDGFSLAAIAKPADTIAIGDTGFDGFPGWAMYCRDPRIAPAGDSRPGYYPQFRHNNTATRTINDTGSGGTKALPISGTANFVFLDGHAKALQPGRAFQEANTEDGVTLTTGPSDNPNTRYVLWNIY